MNDQPTLFADPAAPVPASLVDFLAGIAARYAFGANVSQAQRRAADKAAERMADVLASLKATNPPPM